MSSVFFGRHACSFFILLTGFPCLNFLTQVLPFSEIEVDVLPGAAALHIIGRLVSPAFLRERERADGVSGIFEIHNKRRARNEDGGQAVAAGDHCHCHIAQCVHIFDVPLFYFLLYFSLYFMSVIVLFRYRSLSLSSTGSV